MIFADTTAVVGLAHRSDQWHEPAAAFLRAMPPGERLVTSDFVLDEVFTVLAGTVGPPPAWTFVEALLRSPRWEVVFIDRALFEAALAESRRYRDKRLSFTDCTSFALMRMQGLGTAFTFDEDFSRCGFRCVPGR